MKAIDRVDGAAKALTGFGLALAAGCFLLLGWWQVVPAAAAGGWLMGTGLAQAATGWRN